MECPFCAETIKDEAVVCKHCNRDLRVALPVIAEIQETVLELDRLQRQLDRANTSLALFDRPARFLFLNGGIYVRSEEHTSELQSHSDLVCRLLLEKKKQKTRNTHR